MYKSASKFFQRSSDLLSLKITRNICSYFQNRLIVCLKCNNPNYKGGIKGVCSCGGKFKIVDGLKYFGDTKYDLIRRLQRKIHKKEYRFIKPKDLYVELFPRGKWYVSEQEENSKRFIRIVVNHIPTRLREGKVVSFNDYYGKTNQNWRNENAIICKHLISELAKKIRIKFHAHYQIYNK